MRPSMLVITCLAALLSASTALGATNVPAGNLAGSPTWTAAGSPYVLAGDVTIGSGQTLTIEAGVTVQFQAGDGAGSGEDTARGELRVEGSLVTQGTAANPVVITSAKPTPATNDFYGVVVLAGGSAQLSNTSVRYAKRGLFVKGSTSTTFAGGGTDRCNEGIYVEGASATLSGLEIANSTSIGLNVVNSTSVSATGMRLHHNAGHGLYVADSNLSLRDSLVYDNTGRGIYVSDSTSAIHTTTLEGNTIVANSYGVYTYENYNSALAVVLRDNIIVHNGTYGVYEGNYSSSYTLANNLVWGHASADVYNVSEGATIKENPLFVNEAGRDLRITSRSPARKHASDGNDIGALAYDGAPTPFLAGHIYENTSLAASGSPYSVTGDLTVEQGVTLTIEPGVTLNFASNADVMGGNLSTGKSELIVRGVLLASSAVVLQSSGTAGQWQGVQLTSNSGPSLLDYVTIRDAVNGVESRASNTTVVQHSIVERSSQYGLYVPAGSVVFSGTSIRTSGSHGVYVTDADPTIRESLVYDNTGRGIYVSDSTPAMNTIILENNTIVGNSYGVYTYENYNSALAVVLRDNIIVHNGTYGVYEGNYSTSYTMANNLVWGHASADFYNVSEGATIKENPLFVNETARDLRITSNSPARLHASDGADIGALAYDGTATPFLAGHLYANTTLTYVGSPYSVTGDLTVEPNVTLTIEPGVKVRFAAKADVMGGGTVVDRTELRVLGVLLADGSASRNIVLESAAASPVAGDWDGVQLLSGTNNSFIESATIRHARAGVYSTAGAGTVVRLSTLEKNSQYAVQVVSGAIVLEQLVLRESGSHGLSVTDANPVLRDSLVYDNTGRGIYVNDSTSAMHTTTLEGNTIVGNSYGVHTYENYNSALAVVLRDNIIVHNGTYGIYEGNYSTSYTLANNLVWGHASGDFYNVSEGATIKENPLFVDEAGRDLRITSRSPARKHASDGNDIGALAYDGTATVGLQGHFYENTTLPAGAHAVLGDLTVEQGVTLTIEAGANLQMAAKEDSMGGNDATDRVELRVYGKLLVSGTAANPVRMRSNAAAPARGDWRGVRLFGVSTNSVIANAAIEHAYDGIYSQAGATTLVSGGEISNCAQHGLNVQGGAAVFNGVRIHDNASHGVNVNDADPDLINLVIFRNSGRGVYVSDSTALANTTDILHCTIVGNSYGVYLYENYNSNLRVTVQGSIIASNGAYGIYEGNYATDKTLTYNDVWGHSSADYYNASAGSNSISSNPLFVDAAVGNFHLSGSSPCVDKANPAGTLTSDAEGTTRPIDGNLNSVSEPDIGAYEYNPNANKWPIADAGTDRVVESGKPVSFDGSGSYDQDPTGSIVSWAWDFGDGTTASGPTVTHTFSGGTDRVVTLTVTDNAGATDTDTVNVEVNLPPVAEAGPAKYEDTGVEVVFNGGASTDSDGTIASYHWDFGDGSSATGMSVSHQYQAGGDFTVTLTVTDDDGSIATDTTVAHIFGVVDENAPTITHTPIAAAQPEGQAVTVSATVTDPSGVASVNLHYRTEGAASYTAIAMGRGTGDTFTATIPAGAVALPAVQYYLEATDQASPANTGTSPAGAPSTVHRFTVADRSGPVIAHTAVSDGQAQGQAVQIVATVTDSSTVAWVKLAYRTRGASTFTVIDMPHSGDVFTAQIPASVVALPAVEYYLTAADASAQANESRSPANAPTSVHSFSVVDRSAPVISHTPIATAKPEGTAVAVSATASDNVAVTAMTLYYRADGAASFTAAAMTNSSGTWTASIPAAAVLPPSLEYYLEAKDAANNASVHPSGAPTAFHEFAVTGQDRIAPAIVHAPIANGQVAGSAVSVSATVTDSTGVASVTLRYRKQGTTSFTSLAMASGGGSVYTASIPAAAVVVPGLEYYLEAIDTASPSNTGVEPAGAPGTALHAFSVNAADSSGPTIDHLPIANGKPEGVAVAVNATVTDPSGVASVTLYYRASGASVFASAAMSAAGGNSYSATIPAASVTRAGVDYYLAATDALGNASASPASAPTTWNSFTVQRQFTLAEGDLVITEIMSDPSGTESQREWFEVYNATSSAIDLAGLTFADDGSDDFTVTGTAVVAAHDYFVFGRTTDTALNGGVQVDYVFSGMALANTSDEIVILAGNVEIDRVVYDSAFPKTPGKAKSLSPDALDYLQNDDGSQWCDAKSQLSGGDFGTPGAANDSCAPPADLTPPVIAHTPIADGQPAGMPVAVHAVVTDESGIFAVSLYARSAGSSSWVELPMTAGAANGWQAEIPPNLVTVAGVEYYLEAMDQAPAANLATAPTAGASAPYAFSVVSTDASGPSISHVPVNGPVPAGEAVAISAVITDPSGVANASLHFKAAGGAWASAALVRGEGDTWTGQIPVPVVSAPSFSYYLEATDASSAANGSTLPEQGAQAPFVVEVQAPDTQGPAITHTPVTGEQPAGAAVSIAATVTDDSGVAEVRVYYRAAGAGTFASASLQSTDGTSFTGSIPAAAVLPPGVDYYLEAVDASEAQNLSRVPAGAPAQFHSFTVDETVVADGEGPVIAHTPIADGVPAGQPVRVEATVTDASGVSLVKLYYRVAGLSSFEPVQMTEGSGNLFSAEIPGEAVGADAVEYFLEAVDAAPSRNVSTDPAGAPEAFHAFKPEGTPVDPGNAPAESGCGCASNGGAASSLLALVALAGLLPRRRRQD